MPNGYCKIPGCNRKSLSLGLCSLHYQREYKARTRKRVKAAYGIYKSHPYEAQSFISMRSRCSSPSNTSYARYGGSGIRVCERWSGVNGFSNFLEDMGERPKNTTLDRIDNNGDYSPENCRWADAKDQSRNRKTNIFYTYNGETLVLADWAMRNGLNPGVLYTRWHKGERGERLFRPSQKK